MLTALYSALWSRHKVDIDISIVNVSLLTTGRAPMNFTPGRSGVSNPWHLLERAETRTEKFLQRAIVNAQSLDRAGILFPIVRPASQGLLAGVPPLHRPCVISSSLMAVLLEVLPGTTQRCLSSTTSCV